MILLNGKEKHFVLRRQDTFTPWVVIQCVCAFGFCDAHHNALFDSGEIARTARKRLAPRLRLTALPCGRTVVRVIAHRFQQPIRQQKHAVGLLVEGFVRVQHPPFERRALVQAKVDVVAGVIVAIGKDRVVEARHPGHDRLVRAVGKGRGLCARHQPDEQAQAQQRGQKPARREVPLAALLFFHLLSSFFQRRDLQAQKGRTPSTTGPWMRRVLILLRISRATRRSGLFPFAGPSGPAPFAETSPATFRAVSVPFCW